MTKVLPSDNRLIFLLCEMARAEMGNKLSLLGLYSNDDILVGPGPKNDKGHRILSSVTIVLIFKDGQEKFQTSLSIEGPDGKIALEQDIAELEKREHRSATMVYQVSPFEVRHWGTYKLTIKLDEQVYERTFDIKELEA